MPMTKRQRQNLNAFDTKKKPLPRLVLPGFLPPPTVSSSATARTLHCGLYRESGPEIARVQSGAQGLFSKQTGDTPFQVILFDQLSSNIMNERRAE